MSKNIALEKLMTKSTNSLRVLEEEIESYDDIDLRHILFLLINKLVCSGQHDEDNTRIKQIYRELERIRSQIKAAIDTYSRELKKDDNNNKDTLGYISQMMQVLRKVSVIEEKLNRKDIENIINNHSSSKSRHQKDNDINWDDLDLNL